jgi:hypothetical protein
MFKMSCVLVCALCGGRVGTFIVFNFNSNYQNTTPYLDYTLDECTYRCITYSVTAHPDDGQARPKHVLTYLLTYLLHGVESFLRS